jgi:hypothetical protein
MLSASYLKLSVCVVLAIGFGYLVGRYHSRQLLAHCQQQNAMFTNDLNRAVTRGVILETNLTLCKENKDVSH